MTRARWVVCLAMCAGLGAAPIRSERAAVAPAANVLVELFTSEGCESCPPADALLIDLIRTQPVRGVRIVALSEHVDYWDHLGWTDPFSSSLFTNRQLEYGRAIKAEAYTPQVVVDGRAAVIGSDRNAVIAAIRTAAGKPKPGLQLTWVGQGAERALQISMPVDPALAAGRVLVAITEDRLSNQVKRGENAGRELRHDAVTRRLTEVGAADARGGFSQLVAIGPMLDPQWKLVALHVVVFVQSSQGIVMAVATTDPTWITDGTVK